MTRSGPALPLKPVITSLPGTSGNLPRNILTRGAFTRWAVSSVLLMVASPAAASSGFEAPDQSFEPASDNDAPGAIGSDGETIWVIGFRGRVFAYMLATGARDSAKDMDTLAGADNGDANCMWSDRTVLWVSDYEEAKLLVHSRGTGARTSGRDINSLNATGNSPSMPGNNHPKGFWSDGAVIRAADHVDQKIFVYDLYTGNRRAGREITGLRAAENGRATVMWSDGETRWGDDDGDARIYAHDLSSGDRESHLTLSALTLSSVDPETFSSAPARYTACVRASVGSATLPEVASDPHAFITIDLPDAESNAADHGVSGQLGAAKLQGLYSSSGSHISGSGRSATANGDPQTLTDASTCRATRSAGAGMGER